MNNKIRNSLVVLLGTLVAVAATIVVMNAVARSGAARTAAQLPATGTTAVAVSATPPSGPGRMIIVHEGGEAGHGDQGGHGGGSGGGQAGAPATKSPPPPAPAPAPAPSPSPHVIPHPYPIHLPAPCPPSQHLLGIC